MGFGFQRSDFIKVFYNNNVVVEPKSLEESGGILRC